MTRTGEDRRHVRRGAAAATDDYYHGRDFADEGLELRRPMFAEFTPLLADRYIERFSGGFDGVDFSRYSKVKNQQLKRYNFGFAQLLEPQS
jgi:hypothetical protein